MTSRQNVSVAKDPFLGILDQWMIQYDGIVLDSVTAHINYLFKKFNNGSNNSNNFNSLNNSKQLRFSRESVMELYYVLQNSSDHTSKHGSDKSTRYVIDLVDTEVDDFELKQEFQYVVLRDIFKVYEWTTETLKAKESDLVDPITLESFTLSNAVIFRQWNAKECKFIPVYRSALAMKQFLYSAKQGNSHQSSTASRLVYDPINKVPWSSTIIQYIESFPLTTETLKEYQEWTRLSDQQSRMQKQKQLDDDRLSALRLQRREESIARQQRQSQRRNGFWVVLDNGIIANRNVNGLQRFDLIMEDDVSFCGNGCIENHDVRLHDFQSTRDHQREQAELRDSIQPRNARRN